MSKWRKQKKKRYPHSNQRRNSNLLKFCDIRAVQYNFNRTPSSPPQSSKISRLLSLRFIKMGSMITLMNLMIWGRSLRSSKMSHKKTSAFKRVTAKITIIGDLLFDPWLKSLKMTRRLIRRLAKFSRKVGPKRRFKTKQRKLQLRTFTWSRFAATPKKSFLKSFRTMRMMPITKAVKAMSHPNLS